VINGGQGPADALGDLADRDHVIGDSRHVQSARLPLLDGRDNRIYGRGSISVELGVPLAADVGVEGHSGVVPARLVEAVDQCIASGWTGEMHLEAVIGHLAIILPYWVASP
jgi:hypothetical protein